MDNRNISLTEDEYIITYNKLKIKLAGELIRDLLTGSNYGVDKEERIQVLLMLESWLEKLPLVVVTGNPN